MLIAVTVAAIGAVPALLGVLLGSTLWPPTRRLNRLEKLASTRGALAADSGAAKSLDESIEALADRVRTDTLGKADSSRARLGVWIAVGLMAIGLAALVATGPMMLARGGVNAEGWSAAAATLSAVMGVVASILSSRSSMRAVEKVPRIRQTAPGVFEFDDPEEDS